MEDRVNCLACEVEFSVAEAEQAGHHCPDCGADLVAKGAAGKAAGKKALGLAMAILGLLGAIFLIWQSGLASLGGPMDQNARQQAIAKILKESLEINNKVPMMIDKSTRLDGVVIEAETITCKSTLINLTAENSGGDIFKNQINPFLADQYCNNKNTRKALELGIKYGHEYYGRDGALLYTATITLNDC
jgi:predicted RNA-binding Zn-ribbon protein involved in translation (DUF1610 family)